MAFIDLPLGAYKGRTLLGSAGRNVNLYNEVVPEQAETPYSSTLQLTPGLTLLKAAPNDIIRCTYRATTGNLYAVAGQQVFYVNPQWQWKLLGTLTPSAPSDATPRNTPMSMTDNGSVLLMCDGSIDGWYVDLTQPVGSQTLLKIDTTINQGWYGADRVDYLETFFIANKIGTPIFYCSVSVPTAQTFISEFSPISSTVVSGGVGYTPGDVLTLVNCGGSQTTVQTVDTNGAVTQANITLSGGVPSQPSNPVGVTGGSGNGATFTVAYTTGVGAWNADDFASKVVIADPLVAAVAVQGFIWLLGQQSYEVWFNGSGGGSGALANNTFPFEWSQGVSKNIGCVSVNSIATANNSVFWVSQDANGQGIIVMGSKSVDQRISTHAIEAQLSTYPTISDATAYCYQQQGHYFYVVNFPSAPNYDGQADAGTTWVFDMASSQWHERVWSDSNGIEHRHRANNSANVYGVNVCGDWENSNLYMFDLNNFTDNGQPIKRLIRSGVEIDKEANRRINFKQLIANFLTGTATTNGAGPPATIVNTSFDAADGTLLQSYSNTDDVGATFTKISGVNAEIVNDTIVGSVTGSTLYQASGTPSAPDYVCSFDTVLTNYAEIPADTAEMFVIGRANPSNNGYQAGVISDGTDMSVYLTVMPSGTPATLALGTIASGFYTISLTMQSQAISVAVQRSVDGRFLSSAAAWVGSPTQCISITDTTYTAAGNVLIGGTFP